MKKFVFLVLISIAFVSCSEYQKVLNKGTVSEQYKLAERLYKDAKYNKALVLFEKVIPKFKAKPQMQRIQFMVAKSNFETENYDMAAYYFNRFINNYPKSSKIKEADFLVAQSYYKKSPKYSLDQKDTYKALTALQDFLDKYPNSEYEKTINDQYKELTHKIDKKYFEIAKQFYTIEDYKAAIAALDNYLSDYLGTPYKEDALYYKFLAGYKLAENSVEYKKEKRIKNALKYFDRFKKIFPDSKYLKETETLAEKLRLMLKNKSNQNNS
jgi:outer membrane protein assembly factor BamD